MIKPKFNNEQGLLIEIYYADEGAEEQIFVHYGDYTVKIWRDLTTAGWTARFELKPGYSVDLQATDFYTIIMDTKEVIDRHLAKSNVGGEKKSTKENESEISPSEANDLLESYQNVLQLGDQCQVKADKVTDALLDFASKSGEFDSAVKAFLMNSTVHSNPPPLKKELEMTMQKVMGSAALATALARTVFAKN